MQKITKDLSVMSLLEFVELRTKVASVFPMLVGLLWSIGYYQVFNPLATVVFVLATLTFDMATTAINNTMDFFKAVDNEYKYSENVIGKYNLDSKLMVRIVGLLLVISVLLSLILVWLTDFLLLPMGVVCFMIGIGYTFGPFPLSRLPLGEVFSGLTMGFGITFLAIYIQQPQYFMTLQLTGDEVLFRLAWLELLKIALISLPMVALIANIMLANNICDLEQDIVNQRLTLVYYLGREAALNLYLGLSILPWVGLIAMISLGLLPVIAGIVLFGLPLHVHLVRGFLKKQSKTETFVLSIKAFLFFSLIYSTLLAIQCVILFSHNIR